MTRRVRFEPAAHACPNCGERFEIAGDIHMTPGSLGTEFACDHCSALVSVRVDRRGRLRISTEPIKGLRMPDGSPLQMVWAGPRAHPGTVLRSVQSDVDGQLRIGFGFQTTPREVRLPIYWTPERPGAATVWLNAGAGETLTVVCRCPRCDRRLTQLRWYPGSRGDGDPPLGVVVIDTLLKGPGLPRALLDQGLRDRRYAAALLVCRRAGCKTETAFTFRQPRSLRRAALADVLAACHN